MMDIWAIIVMVILVMIIYGYISSKISEHRKRKLREKSIPLTSEYLKPDISYNVHLSDGRKFLNVQIIGSIEGEDAEFSFAGWEGMFVLSNTNKKKIYIKKSSIRFIEEV